MNHHLDAFLAMAALRDSNLSQLGLMSLAAVSTWYALQLLPARWQPTLRRLYLSGGCAAYLFTFGIQLASIGG